MVHVFFFQEITIIFFLIKFFKYNDYLGYKLTKKNSKLLISETNHLKKKYKFSFLSEITDLRLKKKITNLNIQN